MKQHIHRVLRFDAYVTNCANILNSVQRSFFFLIYFFTWKALDIFLVCKIWTRCFKGFLILEFWFLLQASEDSWEREASISIEGESPKRRKMDFNLAGTDLQINSFVGVGEGD